MRHTRFSFSHTFLPERDRIGGMSLTPEDFEAYLREDGDEEERLGDALRALAVDVETDAVREVRDLRERT